MIAPEVFKLVETAPLFHGVPRQLLEPALRNAKVVKLQPGEKLLTPEAFNEQVYIILSGRLNVEVTSTASSEPVAVLTPGDCVGEMSVLVDGIVSAYVIANTACELLAINYNSFWSLLDGSNEVARNMLNILVRRIRLGNEIMADSLRYHDHLQESLVIDNLTGLYNRHGIHEKFDRLLHRCLAGNQPLSLVLLQLDAFDRTESEEEKLALEQSLRTVAQTMLTFLRPDDHAARLIGKKFAVVLVNTHLAEANTIAERLRAAIGQTPIVLPNGKKSASLTTSTGICEALRDDTWNALVARAEVALQSTTTHP